MTRMFICRHVYSLLGVGETRLSVGTLVKEYTVCSYVSSVLTWLIWHISLEYSDDRISLQTCVLCDPQLYFERERERLKDKHRLKIRYSLKYNIHLTAISLSQIGIFVWIDWCGWENWQVIISRHVDWHWLTLLLQKKTLPYVMWMRRGKESTPGDGNQGDREPLGIRGD